MHVPLESKKVAYYAINKLNSETKMDLKTKLGMIKKEKQDVDAILIGVDVGVASGRGKDSQLTQADLIG